MVVGGGFVGGSGGIICGDCGCSGYGEAVVVVWAVVWVAVVLIVGLLYLNIYRWWWCWIVGGKINVHISLSTFEHWKNLSAEKVCCCKVISVLNNLYFKCPNVLKICLKAPSLVNYLIVMVV